MLNGQKAVVIGGSSGIGLGAVKALLAAGAEVSFTGRDRARLEAASASLGKGARGHAVDGKDGEAMSAFFAGVGPFRHLVLALGGGSAIGPFRELDEKTMRAGYDNKFWPYLAALRAGLPHIEPAGTVTFVTGAAGRRALKGMSGLAAVNGALQAMIGPLALELAPIRVNAVSPGMIATPYWDRIPEEARQAMFERSAASVPVGRVGTAEDIASAILFLAENSFMTGAIIDCDGGVRLV
jgi:NAD(P)-dependent dehydrogenase (short-subunit alcohol dehydrogenase family)